MNPKQDWAWHVHHEILLEPLSKAIQARIDYIKSDKPLIEQNLRLRLLKPVEKLAVIINSGVCQQWQEAYQQLQEAWRQWSEMYQPRQEASPQRQAAYRQWKEAEQHYREATLKLATDPDILALHDLECPDCPWDGKTIFSDKQEGEK
jgi:translation elongation factor EF-G